MVSNCGTVVGGKPFEEGGNTFVIHLFFNLTLSLDIQSTDIDKIETKLQEV